MVKNTPKIQALLGWMGVLSDPTRLRLLRLLGRQELGVAELCQVLQMPQSSVSRHLKLLADHGWVHHRRQGTSNLYRAAGDDLDTAAHKLLTLANEQARGWPTFEQDHLRLARLLRQREHDTQSFFAGAASQWSTLRRELYGSSFQQAALLALLPPGYTVADLGCGTGELAAEIAPHVARVIGVDNSDAMLKAARKRAGELENVELRRGSLDALPIEDAACDAAMLVLVLAYVSDVSAVLAEAARVLRPGGRIVVVDLLEHDREEFRRQMGQSVAGFSADEVRAKLAAAGFADPRMTPLPPEKDAKGPALFVATGAKGPPGGT